MGLPGLPHRVLTSLEDGSANWEWLKEHGFSDEDPAAGRSDLGLAYDTILPWQIDIDSFLTAHTQTNWATITADSVVGGGAIHGGWLQSSGAQNAEVGWDVVVAAGTWTFSALVLTNTDAGIITVSLDGSSIGTIDTYSASLVLNSLKTITGVAVATTGKKRLLLKMATKNASSSSYVGLLQSLALRRTA